VWVGRGKRKLRLWEGDLKTVLIVEGRAQLQVVVAFGRSVSGNVHQLQVGREKRG
jgi:hypothetical protein